MCEYACDFVATVGLPKKETNYVSTDTARTTRTSMTMAGPIFFIQLEPAANIARDVVEPIAHVLIKHYSLYDMTGRGFVPDGGTYF